MLNQVFTGGVSVCNVSKVSLEFAKNDKKPLEKPMQRAVSKTQHQTPETHYETLVKRIPPFPFSTKQTTSGFLDTMS